MQSKTVTGIIFWALLAAFVIPGIVCGWQKLVAHPQKVKNFKSWGYSIMFLRFLGFGELVALIALLLNQLRYLGLPVFFTILWGAG